jgi:hypothetical protein
MVISTAMGFSLAMPSLGWARGGASPQPLEHPKGPAEDPTQGVSLDGSPSLPFWETVKKNDLLPGIKASIKVESGKVKYLFSKFFDLEGERVATLGIVDLSGKKYLRLYYTSRSQGGFRVLPALNEGTNSKYLPRYDKGDGENSLGLPSGVQEVLAHELLTGTTHSLSEEDSKIIREGAVWVNHTPADQEKYLQWKGSISSFLQNEFILKKGQTIAANVPPGEVTFKKNGNAPNFSHLLRKYESMTQLSGRVEVTVYPSINHHLEYVFMKDHQNRVWVSSILAADAELNSYGVPSIAVFATDLTLPLWEYLAAIPRNFKSGGVFNPHDSKYGSTWKYISKLPTIRHWYSANHLPIPGEEDHSD